MSNYKQKRNIVLLLLVAACLYALAHLYTEHRYSEFITGAIALVTIVFTWYETQKKEDKDDDY